MIKMTKTLNSNDNVVDKIGSFMGFDNSSDSESEEDLDVEQGRRILNEVVIYSLCKGSFHGTKN